MPGWLLLNVIVLQPITPNQISLQSFVAKKSSVTTKAIQGNIWAQINLKKKKKVLWKYQEGKKSSIEAKVSDPSQTL